jgi:nucleoside 2-deoxyribosyltransferase
VKRVYLASRFGRQGELRGHREQLHAMGVEVTSSWLDAVRDDQANAESDLAEIAEKNFTDIEAADAFIVFTDEGEGAKRGGHHVELGFAFAAGKDVAVIGPRINVFHYHGDVNHFESWPEFLATAEDVKDVA